MAGDNSALRRRALAALILSESQRGGAGHGARLPTERQLATELGVSRSTIRHAMAMLQAEGHVSREVGRGTFLRHPAAAAAPASPAAAAAPADRAEAPGWGPGAGGATSTSEATSTGAATPSGGVKTAGGEKAGPGRGLPRSGGGLPGSGDGLPRSGGGFPGPDVSSGSDDYSPADVIMVRRLFEPTAMSLVVAWATARDFVEMDRCLQGGERAADHDEFEVWDAALHRSIIAATRSPLLIRLYAEVERARHGRMWGDLKRRSASAARRDEYRRDHEEIVAALKTRDSDLATAAMRNHLARVSRHLLGTE
jgi:DNA-binding FadR family transcriptional regulator